MPHAHIMLVGVAFALNACASTRPEVDPMCPAIAAFANASVGAGVHSVQLTTDWGGVYTKSEDPGEQLMAAKGCEHGGYEPGRVLCEYLLDGTSTEFSGMNYRRALRCIGVRISGSSPSDDQKLPPSAISHHVSGVRQGVAVTIQLAHATEAMPPTLKISAQSKGR